MPVYSEADDSQFHTILSDMDNCPVTIIAADTDKQAPAINFNKSTSAATGNERNMY